MKLIRKILELFKEINVSSKSITDEFNEGEKVTLVNDLKREIFTVVKKPKPDTNGNLLPSYNCLVRDKRGSLWTFRYDSLELCTSYSLYDSSMDLYHNWMRNKRQQKINLLLGEVDEDLDKWISQYVVREEYCHLAHERTIKITVPIGKLK